MIYIPRYTRRWIDNLKKYSSLIGPVLRKVEQILKDPDLHTREILRGTSRTRKVDLTGLRSAEVRRKYRIIFILCRDCIAGGLKEQGVFFCEKCEEEREGVIKFLAFGSHDDAYHMR